MAIDLSSEIYRLAKQFPPEETYALRIKFNAQLFLSPQILQKGMHVKN